jgi:N-acetylglucosamine-6-phosphate deacetylase
LTHERVLTGARVLTPDTEAAWVALDGGRIAAVGDGDPPPAREITDLTGRLVVPGFIDLHVHGGDGADFMGEDLVAAVELHARHGTTRLLATTVSAPPAALLQAVRTVAAAGDPHILGIHLEGPWLSDARRGAQDPAALRAPDPRELDALLGAGCIRMVTLAPELPGALDLITRVVAAGAVASLGHTDATYDEAIAGIEAGARHATHTFNGMRELHHREPGAVGAVLDRYEVTCELIADGHHVHPAAVRLVARAKGARGVAFVTDAIAAAGRPDGDFHLGAVPVRVRDGRATTHDGHLAGSTLTLDAAVRNAVAWGIALPDALAMASTVPARVLGLRKGRIAPGYDADLTILDADLRAVGTLVAR